MKPKLIYFYPAKATFVERDISFLSKKFDILTQDLPWTHKGQILMNFAKQFFFILKNSSKTRVYLVMFGGYWSFLPALFGKLFNKQVFIILGGTDCVSFPEINYGSLRKPLLKWFIKKSYQWCTRLLPVDESLLFSNSHYHLNASHKQQGVKAFFKNLKTPYTVIPNGFDVEFWKNAPIKKIPNSFVSIAYINDKTRFTLKGFDRILKLATHFKEANFTLIGISEPYAKTLIMPQNVTLFHDLKPNELKAQLAKHQFYLQLSLSEGFPNALAEAMLMRCIPIGSAVGAIPKIIDQTGIVMTTPDEAQLIFEIEKLLNLAPLTLEVMGLSAQMQISTNFSIQNRIDLMCTTLSENL